jgi:hypothetical protein
MTTQERLLYTQVHPIKITVDLISMIVSLYLTWQHLWLAGLIVLLVPSTLATLVVLRISDLSLIHDSPLGNYLRNYMTRAVDWARTAGLSVMIYGAWMHMPLVICVGGFIIVAALLSGVLFPNPE